MRGIIYKYTAPNGLIYIGQTINESRRRSEFLNIDKKYAGGKINKARNLFNPEMFKYEVIFSKEYTNYKSAKRELNKLEQKYIKLYNSFHNGLNGNYGGDNCSLKNLFVYFVNRFIK